MKTEQTRGIVLRRTNYGEADRIIQYLTLLGRRSVIAKGVRKEKSRLAGGIELFSLSDIVIGSGRGELGLLTSARMVKFYSNILEDYDRLEFGYEAIKQVARASEIVDEPEWFSVLLEVIQALDVKSIDLRLIETWFYLRYSQLLGHELGLQYDVDGNKLESGTSYRYNLNEKGFEPSERGDIATDHLKLLRLVASKSIQTIVQVGGVSGIMGVCRDAARQHASIY